jgi:hypothetical protein
MSEVLSSYAGLNVAVLPNQARFYTLQEYLALREKETAFSSLPDIEILEFDGSIEIVFKKHRGMYLKHVPVKVQGKRRKKIILYYAPVIDHYIGWSCEKWMFQWNFFGGVEESKVTIYILRYFYKLCGGGWSGSRWGSSYSCGLYKVVADLESGEVEDETLWEGEA